MRVGIIFSTVPLLIGSAGQASAGPQIVARAHSAHYRIQQDSARTLDLPRITLVEPADARWPMDPRRGVRGDGNGADLDQVQVVQTSYSATDPTNGNGLLVIWAENVFNGPASITVSLDGTEFPPIDGLPQGQVPGMNSFPIPNVPAGAHTLIVESLDGSFGEDAIVALNEQPVADVENLKCEEGPVTATGCVLDLSWTSCAPFPIRTRILVSTDSCLSVDGGLLILEIEGPFQGILFNAPPGNYTFRVISVLENDEGTYWGGCVEAPPCIITCEDDVCDPPAFLNLHQSGYAPEGGEVLGFWDNGEPTYTAVTVYVDGTSIGQLAGDASFVFITPFAPGTYRIGLQGNCGPAVQSTITERSITVIAETPHPDPVKGDIRCEYDAAMMVTTATWTNSGCTNFILPYVAIGGDLNNLALLDGDPAEGFQLALLRADATTVAATPTGPDDLMVLQFFTTVGGQCYGSPLIPCTFEPPPPPGNTFIRGICNGLVSDPQNPTPQITSAVFLFNFLFLGGELPPCREACNVNGDRDPQTQASVINLTDGVFLLNFLFLGGPAPLNWVDATGDGRVDPTCERAPMEACATSHSFCPP